MQQRRHLRNRAPLPPRPPPRGGGSGDGSGRTSGNSGNCSSGNSGNCAKVSVNPRNLGKGKAPVVPEAGSSSGPQHGHGVSGAQFGESELFQILHNLELPPGAREHTHTHSTISSDFSNRITQRLGVDDQITLPQDGSSVRDNHIYSTIPCPPDAGCSLFHRNCPKHLQRVGSIQIGAGQWSSRCIWTKSRDINSKGTSAEGST